MTSSLERRLQPADRKGAVEAPVFFMHIAKTAGSYVNSLLVDAIGADRVLTHIELNIGNSVQLQNALDRGVTVFSGHVMHGLWEAIAAPIETRFRKISVVRDPIEHLASHILWLDHYNRSDQRRDYLALDEAHRRVADRVGAIDVSDVGQLDQFLTEMSPTEVRLFDNCQSRYFLMPGRRELETHRPLSLADAKALGRAVGKFDIVARQDRLEADIPQIGRKIGVQLSYMDRRVNPAKSERRIETSNPLVRQVLGKRTILDQWLWRYVGMGQVAS